MDLINYVLSKKNVSDLKNELGDAAYLNVPSEGRDAEDDEVVLGRDSRLTGPRPPAPHTHKLSDITDAGTAAAYNIPIIGNASINEVVMGDDTRLTDSRDPNPHTHLKGDITDFSHTHTLNEITNVPENSGAEYSVSIMGDARNNELVLGDDSRLSDSRDPNPHTHILADVTNAGTSAALNYSNIVTAGDDTHVVTGKAVADAISKLPEPMVFRGSLGIGGTITSLPLDGTASKGDTYKVITNGVYAEYPAKIGDTFVCESKTSSSNTWTHIPSGDEPSGTVISVGASAGNNGVVVETNVGNNDPIIESGVISVSHADTSSQVSTSNSGRTYIQNISLDDYGHITNLTSATETVVDTNTTYSLSRDNTSVKLTPSSGAAETVSLDSLLTNLPSWTATPTDDTYLIRRDTGGGASYGQVKFSTIWNYIDGKVSAAGYTKNTGTVTQVKVGSTAYNPSSGVVSLPAYPIVPTKVSELTNDSGFVTTDKKVTPVNLTHPTSETVYRPLIVPNADPTTNRQPNYSSLAWQFVLANGTASAAGWASIRIGNSTATGTANNMQGYLRLYGANSYYASLEAATLTANRAIKLPNAAGTIALTSDIPTSLPASDVYSWAKASTKPSYTASEVGALASTTKYAASESVGGAAKKVYGYYTSNGGVQPPNYFGTNAVGFLMSNVTLSNDSHYKNIMYMDCYSGTDVGGTTAFAIDRTEARAWILQADKNRTDWNNTAELITSKNIGSQSVSSATTASSLSKFSVSTSSNLGLEITTNVHGYVSGLTKAAWNSQQTDGAIYGQFYSDNWKHEIFGDYRTGQIAVRGKNNGTWTDWKSIGMFTSTPTTGQVVITDGTSGGIKSSGFTIATSVPSGAVFTDTNTKVTSSANHYTPSTASGSDKTASASGATAAWSIDVVKGITLNTDGKGHVTGISVTSGKIPANPNTDTKVKQSASTSSKWRKVLLHYTEDAASTTAITTSTNEVYAAVGVSVQPSTGTLAATKFSGPLTGNVTGNCSGSSGSCTGNAATATKATQDGSGNTITSTYFKKAGDTISGATTVNAAITFGKDDSYGIFTTTDNYCSIGSSSKYFYRGYINNMYCNTLVADASVKAGTASTTTGKFILQNNVNTYQQEIVGNASITEHRNYELPNASGTIALTSGLVSSTTVNLTWSSVTTAVTFTLYANGIKGMVIALSTTPAAAYTSGAVIPAAYRPTGTVYFAGFNGNYSSTSNNKASRNGALDSTGKIYVYASNTTGLWASCFYM